MAESSDVQKSTKAGADRLWMVDPGTIRGIMHGPLPNKSNSKKIVMVGKPGQKRPLIIKSDEARKYEVQFETACWSCLRELGRLPDGAKLYFRAVVFQQNLLRDLDCELLPDLLQKNNIIANDRAIWRKDYERRIDKENPRVEFEIGVWNDPAVRSLFDKV